MIINKIWPLGEKSVKIDTFVVNDFTIKFRIRDSSTRSRALRRHMWNIAGIPMYVTKWSPLVEEAQPTLDSVPLWVVLKNVPHTMFSWEGLGFIASAVGKPTKLHPDTETCKSFEEAKVSVIADLTKELPKSSRFKSKKGIDTVVEFSYPWLPARCNLCSKWGHISADCVVGKTGAVSILARKDNRGEKISAVASPVNMTERATHEDASTILTPQAVGDKSCGKLLSQEQGRL